MTDGPDPHELLDRSEDPSRLRDCSSARCARALLDRLCPPPMGSALNWTCEDCIEAAAVADAEPSEASNELPGLAYRHCRSCGVQAPTPVSEAVDVDEPWTCANCHVDDTEPELKPTQVEL